MSLRLLVSWGGSLSEFREGPCSPFLRHWQFMTTFHSKCSMYYTLCTGGHKSHDPCFPEFLLGAGVMTFVTPTVHRIVPKWRKKMYRVIPETLVYRSCIVNHSFEEDTGFHSRIVNSVKGSTICPVPRGKDTRIWVSSRSRLCSILFLFLFFGSSSQTKKLTLPRSVSFTITKFDFFF